MLSEQEKSWISEAVKKSLEHQRILWAESEAEALEKIQEKGVRISYPDKEPFIEMTREMYRTYEDDEALNSMIQQIKTLAN